MIKLIEELKFAHKIINPDGYQEIVDILIYGNVKSINIREISENYIRSIVFKNNKTKKLFEDFKKKNISYIIGIPIIEQTDEMNERAVKDLLKRLNALTCVFFNKIENISFKENNEKYEVVLEKYIINFTVIINKNNYFKKPIMNKYHIHSIYNKKLRIKNRFNKIMEFREFTDFIDNRAETFEWNQDILDMISI